MGGWLRGLFEIPPGLLPSSGQERPSADSDEADDLGDQASPLPPDAREFARLIGQEVGKSFIWATCVLTTLGTILYLLVIGIASQDTDSGAGVVLLATIGLGLLGIHKLNRP